VRKLLCVVMGLFVAGFGTAHAGTIYNAPFRWFPHGTDDFVFPGYATVEEACRALVARSFPQYVLHSWETLNGQYGGCYLAWYSNGTLVSWLRQGIESNNDVCIFGGTLTPARQCADAPDCPLGQSRNLAGGLCEAPTICPVLPLTPITDPNASLHESGIYDEKPDMSRVSAAITQGAECILQKAAASGGHARITSAYRPSAYQAHFWDIYSKWKLLENNNDPICKVVKDSVLMEKSKHQILITFATSPHSSGNAIDIKGVPASQADTFASQCNMYRPLPKKDPVHYLAR
jgi:hypothetical protein